MKELSHGAEAVILAEGSTISKQRVKKGYRINELDKKLRIGRTRREARILDKLLEEGLKVPKVISVDEKNATIQMELIEGKKVRDILDVSNCATIGRKIGEAAARMHSLHIIHGDLTTSNMIANGKDIYFVDFGLGFSSEKTEDKAVDLHLLRQALNSSHSKISDNCFAAVAAAYRKKCGSDVLKRLEKVEARGRYKGKK